MKNLAQFQTTFDFDCKYLWNRSTKWRSENVLSTTPLPYMVQKIWWTLVH